MVDVKTRSAHSRSESVSGATFMSTTRSSYSGGNMAAMVSRPKGGKTALMPTIPRA